jgi:Cu/Ag efflux protein CusF
MIGPEKGTRFAVVLSVFLWVAMSSVVSAAEQFAGDVLKVDVTAKKLTVKKPDGNRFTFVVDNATSFAGSRRSLQELTQGDKVTVEFQMTAGKYQALKIVTP